MQISDFSLEIDFLAERHTFYSKFEKVINMVNLPAASL